ncbi:MAG: cold shock domain-containing protein, partial [Thermoanaerobaculia bacterium]|nr:cold shock domain-containing protein [Thermoanaerobaculia bacterium]
MADLHKKYIGVIKWFHDRQRDADYGFIQHPKLGDIYFNSKNILAGQSMKKFDENEVVVFEERKSSRKKDSCEAYNVKLIENEEDITFLFSEFLILLSEKGNYSDYNLVQKKVFSSIQKLKTNIDETANSELHNLFFAFAEGIAFTFEKAKILINLARLLFPDYSSNLIAFIFSKLDKEILFLLWLEGTNENIDIEYAALKMRNSASEKMITQILTRCKESEKFDLILKVLSDLGQIDNLEKYKSTIQILDYCRKYSINKYERIIDLIIKNSPSNFRLDLWLRSFSDYYDFDEFAVHINGLSFEEQGRFFKKTINLIDKGLANLKIKDLNKIQIENIDYSLSIVIQALDDLAKAQVTKRETIFEIIAKQIKSPSDLLQVRGFFDECRGRCRAIVTGSENEDEGSSTREVQLDVTDKKPRFAVYCDGRKANVLCKTTGLEFWWCENNKCYKPSRELHSNEQWEQYSLWDFLRILKIEFREADYEILLNVINKVNRFLERIKCQSCNEILRPIKKTKYSFWGVSDFHCTNISCNENEVIYISHCLNGKCEGIIDSRDSVKCRIENHKDCGWYVCNFCNACCNSPQLAKRKWVYDNILHEEYPCHLIGHKDLGQLCCNKCGSTMSNSTNLTDEYPRILNWFIENKEINPHILKSGQRKDGKWWFTFAKNNLSVEEYRKKLSKLISI